uniref:Uncharacterized protein n=1 Tax=Glossina austeni TaxID=7395 RepID=A0A1A9UNB1_GLOAU
MSKPQPLVQLENVDLLNHIEQSSVNQIQQLHTHIVETTNNNILSFSSNTSPTMSDERSEVEDDESHNVSGKTSTSNQSSPAHSPRRQHFSNNIISAHLRQDSLNIRDGNEICLVPEIDFECTMDNNTDNRESQPLLSGVGPNNRDQYEAAFNTFMDHVTAE